MRREKTFKKRDDSAVSILVGYIVNIGIAALVVSLTLLLLQGAFTDVRERAVESELEAVGESFAGEIERVDILSQSGNIQDVRTSAKVPQTGTSYTMTVLYSDAEGARLLLESGQASIEVPFKNETAIAGAGDGVGVSSGSTPEIVYDSSEDEIQIR